MQIPSNFSRTLPAGFKLTANMKRLEKAFRLQCELRRHLNAKALVIPHICTTRATKPKNGKLKQAAAKHEIC